MIKDMPLMLQALKKYSLLSKSMLIHMCEHNPMTAYSYAYYVLLDPWPEGEVYIARSARASYYYARAVLLCNPFPAGEDQISKNGVISYLYARHCLGKPFPKGERAMRWHPYSIVNMCCISDQRM